MFVVCPIRAYNLLEACTQSDIMNLNTFHFYILIFSYLSGKSNMISHILYEKIEKKIYSSWYHNNIAKVYWPYGVCM